MPTIDINSILTETGKQIEGLALATASKYKDQAIVAGKKILSDMKDDLARWTQMLADGKLSTAEFELLVKSYKVEIAMSALKQAGLAEIRAFEFGKGVLNIAIDVAFKTVESAGGNLLTPK